MVLAEIRPLKALRYDEEKAGAIEQLTCPPYDIISEPQRQAYLQENALNVIRLELPKGENPYEEARQTLQNWLSEGILKTDFQEGFYLYEEEFLTEVDHGEKKSLSGLLCLVQVEDFENGVVLPHEETLSKAKEDRLNLLKATGCNFSPIYSLYRDESHVTQKRLQSLRQTTAPRYAFSDGLVTHRLWVINDALCIAALREDFTGRKLYIADGHHRYETAINYRNYCRDNHLYNPGSGYVMMLLADMGDEGLVVFPTHRLLHGLQNFSSEKILADCTEYFHVEPVASSADVQARLGILLEQKEIAFGFVSQNACAILTLKDRLVMREILPQKSDAYRFLDVSVLHSLILERLLDIDKENMANQKNLTYTRSLEEALSSVEAGESDCAFLLNPTRVSEIGDVAANGEKMPQKSTYFYPKPITGLVMNKLDETT